MLFRSAAHLEKHGYAKAGLADGLLKHKARGISFTLAVDGFGIKHTREEDAQHLAKIMRDKHTFKAGMKAEQYIGIHLGWGYGKRELIASMKGCAKQALAELQPRKMLQPRQGTHMQQRVATSRRPSLWLQARAKRHRVPGRLPATGL